MSGERYGKWTVIEFSRKGKRGELYWNCKCDCGTEREVDGYSLRRGYSKSCGCATKYKWKERHKSGERFGRLTCLRPADEKYKWVVKCDCGNVKTVSMFSMERGSTLSCGCLRGEEVAERNTRRRKSLTGQRFGRLVVVKNVEPDKYGASRYLCRCDCGNQTIVGISKLRSGDTWSCGCAKYKHGDCKRSGHDPLYIVWSRMKSRCFNPNEKEYKNYGGRGISICDEWKNDYTSFRNWAKSNGYKHGLEIDRIDNNQGYCPDNCRWVTTKENCRNKSNNRNLTALGKTQCMSAWAEEIGLTPGAIRNWVTRHNLEYAENRLAEYVKRSNSGEVEA